MTTEAPAHHIDFIQFAVNPQCDSVEDQQLIISEEEKSKIKAGFTCPEEYDNPDPRLQFYASPLGRELYKSISVVNTAANDEQTIGFYKNRMDRIRYLALVAEVHIPSEIIMDAKRIQTYIKVSTEV